MGFVNFEINGASHEAEIYYETASEDGWVVTYDDEKYLFYVWSNCESKIMGNEPDEICKNLEEVLKKVNSYT